MTPARADDYTDTIKIFQKASESSSFFSKCYGYAVFPTIGKGGVGIGGAHGNGRVYAKGAYVGDVSALSRLNERYHAPTIVVAVVEGDKDAGPLSVGGLRYDAQTGARTEIAKVTVPDTGQLSVP